MTARVSQAYLGTMLIGVGMAWWVHPGAGVLSLGAVFLWMATRK